MVYIMNPKSKKIDLTSEKKIKLKPNKKELKIKNKYNVGDIVIYVSHLHSDYNGKLCLVLKKRKSHIQHHYEVEFQKDKKIIKDVNETSLFTIEEFDNYQKEQEEKKLEDKQTIKNNINVFESHYNFDSCLNPIAFYEIRCNKCRYEKKCVYKNKYNYGCFNLK